MDCTNPMKRRIMGAFRAALSSLKFVLGVGVLCLPQASCLWQEPSRWQDLVPQRLWKKEAQEKPVPGNLQGEIAFHSDRNGQKFQIYVISASGQGLRNLSGTLSKPGESLPSWLRRREEDEDPCWSPDGQYIAFCRFPKDGGWTQLWIMRWNGSDKRCLTQANGNCSQPKFSPDGKAILYVLAADYGPEGKVTRDCIEQVSVGGGAARRLFAGPPGRLLYNGGVSRDGTRLLFGMPGPPRAGIAESPVDIYVLEIDTGEIRRLPSSNGNDTDPCWSPDCSKIAFVSTRDGGPAQIYVMNADGSDQRRLTFDRTKCYSCPSWSPDGRYIVFCRSRSLSLGHQLFILDVETGEQYRLTTPTTAWPGQLSSDWFPSWRPAVPPESES